MSTVSTELPARLLRVAEVARYLSLSRGCVYRIMDRGDLPYVKIGKNCSIDPSTVFQGPVSIGDNVTIGPGCVITQCVIGNNVTLTFNLRRLTAAAPDVVDDSIATSGAVVVATDTELGRIGAHAVDNLDIRVRDAWEKIGEDLPLGGTKIDSLAADIEGIYMGVGRPSDK